MRESGSHGRLQTQELSTGSSSQRRLRERRIASLLFGVFSLCFLLILAAGLLIHARILEKISSDAQAHWLWSGSILLWLPFSVGTLWAGWLLSTTLAEAWCASISGRDYSEFEVSRGLDFETERGNEASASNDFVPTIEMGEAILQSLSGEWKSDSVSVPEKCEGEHEGESETSRSLSMDPKIGLLFDRFELELLKTDQASQIVYGLSAFANQLFEAPALFFEYISGIHSAVLLNSVGLSAAEARKASFPIDEKVRRRVEDAESRGEVPYIADYLPLRDAVLRHFNTGRFMAWALTGSPRQKPGQAQLPAKARLLGVLVVLRSPAQSLSNSSDRPSGRAVPGEGSPEASVSNKKVNHEIDPQDPRHFVLGSALMMTGTRYESRTQIEH